MHLHNNVDIRMVKRSNMIKQWEQLNFLVDVGRMLDENKTCIEHDPVGMVS